MWLAERRSARSEHKETDQERSQGPSLAVELQGFEDRTRSSSVLCMNDLKPQSKRSQAYRTWCRGADHVHGSSTNSASSILRRRIHGFAIPAHNDERFLKKYLCLDIVLDGSRR